MWTSANARTDLDAFFWSKSDSNYLDVKLNVFKKVDNREFQPVQNLTMGEANFNQFMRLRNQLVIAAENNAKEENLSPVSVPTMSKNMHEQLKLAHKKVDLVERAKRKTCVLLLPNSVDKPKRCYVQVRIFARKKEDEKIFTNCPCELQTWRNCHSIDVMISVYDKVIAKKSVCNTL